MRTILLILVILFVPRLAAASEVSAVPVCSHVLRQLGFPVPPNAPDYIELFSDQSVVVEVTYNLDGESKTEVHRVDPPGTYFNVAGHIEGKVSIRLLRSESRK